MEPGEAAQAAYRGGDPHTLAWDQLDRSQRGRWAAAERASAAVAADALRPFVSHWALFRQWIVDGRPLPAIPVEHWDEAARVLCELTVESARHDG